MHQELSPEELEVVEFLWERKYKLDAIGLTSKNVFDWSKQGLLLDPIKPKARRKYCVVEFMWLKLVVGLREFGLSLDAIRTLRETLLAVIGFDELIKIMDSEEFIEAAEKIGRTEDFEKARKMREEAMENFSEEEMNETLDLMRSSELQFVFTLISHLTFESIWYDRDIYFFIKSDGECRIGVSEEEVQVNDDSDFFLYPYIKFPLRLLLSQFVQTENVITNDEAVKYRILSEKEAQVIDLLKRDKLVSLTVRMNDEKKITLIETEEDIQKENYEKRLKDLIVRNAYQNIEYKSQDGKITSIRRKTRYK